MEVSSVPGGPSTSSLGKYRLIAELGHGGMAEVFLAVVRGPAGFNKLVVIKQIRPQLAEDPEFLGMFLDEARLAARLSHPNVVQTNEVGQDGDRYFIAMEYLEGQPLNRILHRLGKAGGTPLGVHLRVLIDVLSGLHHAHELTDYDGTPLGVVHRDVTPHNVFVTYDGQVKVVDFGIAKALNSSSETRSGVLKGKVAYMSPEQARGERVDRRADVFSVGVMMWESLTGRRLWKGVPDISILQRLLSGDIPSPRTLNPGVDDGLEAICMKSLALQREDRYATAAELQAELEAAVEALGERLNSRDIGKLVTQHFEADRTRIKALIEEQLRARPGDVVGLPMIDPPSLFSIVERTSSPSGAGSGPSGVMVRGADGTPSAVFPLGGTPPGLLSHTPSHPSVGPTSTLAGLSAGADPARSSRRKLIAGFAVAGGVALAVGLWTLIRSQPPAPDAQAQAGQPAGSAAARVGSMVVSVTVTPPAARLFLDDQPLATNPFAGSLPRDGAVHKLRAEAPGFAPASRLIVFDKDFSIELALIPTPASTAAAPTGAPTDLPAQAPPRRLPGNPTPADDDMKRPTPRPRRTLDATNPYGQ